VAQIAVELSGAPDRMGSSRLREFQFVRGGSRMVDSMGTARAAGRFFREQHQTKPAPVSQSFHLF
jgi:hypothetical protein